MLLDWIDCADLIPENLLSTWWSCYRSLVDPSVVEVHHVDEISIWDKISNMISGGLMPFEGVKEVIDYHYLLFAELRCVVVHTEHDTQSSGEEAIWRALVLKMDCVHLQIKILSIICMLRWRVEMELFGVKSYFLSCSKELFWKT